MCVCGAMAIGGLRRLVDLDDGGNDPRLLQSKRRDGSRQDCRFWARSCWGRPSRAASPRSPNKILRVQKQPLEAEERAIKTAQEAKVLHDNKTGKIRQKNHEESIGDGPKAQKWPPICSSVVFAVLLF